MIFKMLFDDEDEEEEVVEDDDEALESGLCGLNEVKMMDVEDWIYLWTVCLFGLRYLR